MMRETSQSTDKDIPLPKTSSCKKGNSLETEKKNKGGSMDYRIEGNTDWGGEYFGDVRHLPLQLVINNNSSKISWKPLQMRLVTFTV